MDDGILARAKLLSQAANQMASELSNQANEYKAVVDARHRDQADSAAQDQHEKKKADKQRVPKGKDIGNQKEFRGAVINGSTLITTYSDMRAFVPRGSTITIDGVVCRLQQNNNAEWTANRMELMEDFTGPTNLDATLVTTVTAEVVRRRSPRKNKAAPVKSTDILSAVSHLDDSSMLSGREPLPNPREYMSQNQSHLNSARSSAGNKVRGTKTTKTSSGPGAANSSIATGRSEYDTLGSISSKSSRSSSLHPLNHLNKRKGSNVGGSTSSPSRSVTSTATAATAVSSVPPRSECTHLQEEQYQMMLEIDSLTEEEKEQARIEMNLRMVDRGQRKANERVEEYKHRLNLPATLMEDQPYSSSMVNGSQIGSPCAASVLSGPSNSYAVSGFGAASSSLHVPGGAEEHRGGRGEHLSEEQLVERRREARERYLQKQREEDAVVEANFRAERELQEAVKKSMADKAKKLQEITAQRVATYKANKREQARKEKEAKELAIALKKEKDKEALSEEYIQRMHARMLETEKRLNRQKKEQEDMAHVQKLLEQVQLKELAAARQRTENTQDYVHVGHKSTPSPKKKLPKKKDLDKDNAKAVKLPRLDFSGKNSKNVRNINSMGKAAVESKASEDGESGHKIAVTVGVHDHYHRRGNLSSPRNSKSEQSRRHPSSHTQAQQDSNTRRNRRIHKQASLDTGIAGGQQEQEQPPAVTHVVHIGKPPKQPQSPGKADGNVARTGAQMRFDAFDDDDDNFFDDDGDDGNLSDDSLTLGAHPTKSSVAPSQGNGSRSRIPVPVHRGAYRDSDAASCVSALTVDDHSEQFSTQSRSEPQPAVPSNKNRKKKKKVWKMQPIDMRAYVPVPEEKGGVENR